MQSVLIIAMMPWLAHAPNHANEADRVLRNVEAHRLALRSGVLEFHWSQRHDGVEIIRFEADAAFAGQTKYRMSLRNHSSYHGQPADLREPQCVQVVDGTRLMGMWYSGATQRFFVDDLERAKLTLFHPLGLGLFAYPFPTSDVSSLFFWRGSDMRLSDVRPTSDNEFVVLVEGDGRSGPFTAEVHIDTERGWNITSYTASVASGYKLSVRNTLSKYGEFWFPAQTWATLQFPGTEVSEIYVEVLQAEFSVDLPDDAFSWSALGPPDDGRPKAMVLDYRAGGGALGWWDGRTLSESPRRVVTPSRP